MNSSFQESFRFLKDHRVERTKKHAFLDIIALGILGLMAGVQSFEEVEDFGNLHREWLKRYLQLDNGIPSHDTLNRVFQNLDPKAFQKAFFSWIKTLKTLLPEKIVPIDGKTLRGSFQPSKGLVQIEKWSSLASIVKMTSIRESRGEKSEEERYFISSLSPKDPGKILQAIRSHWQIESVHWSLDVSFGEDSSRLRCETTALNLS